MKHFSIFFKLDFLTNPIISKQLSMLLCVPFSWSLPLLYPLTSLVILLLDTDTYSELVPMDGPPSFRGQAVKYVYKLTIGCQRVNSPIKLLRVPFRVLVLHGTFPIYKYCNKNQQE